VCVCMALSRIGGDVQSFGTPVKSNPLFQVAPRGVLYMFISITTSIVFALKKHHAYS
jgi:hypothetical protein